MTCLINEIKNFTRFKLQSPQFVYPLSVRQAERSEKT